MEIVIQNYNLEKNEFWKARNIYAFRFLNLVIKSILLLISLFFVWVGAKISDVLLIFYIILAFIIIYFIFMITNIYIIPFKRYRKSIQTKYKQSIIINSDGIKFVISDLHMEYKGMETKLNNSEWSIQWNKLRRVAESDKLYVLLFDKLLCTIPKRLFEKAEDGVVFKKILDKSSEIDIDEI